jgi:hypothetical protein
VRTFHNLPSWVNICCPSSTQETSWSCSLDMSVAMGKRCDHDEIVMRDWHRDVIVMRGCEIVTSAMSQEINGTSGVILTRRRSCFLLDV